MPHALLRAFKNEVAKGKPLSDGHGGDSAFFRNDSKAGKDVGRPAAAFCRVGLHAAAAGNVFSTPADYMRNCLILLGGGLGPVRTRTPAAVGEAQSAMLGRYPDGSGRSAWIR